MPARLRWRRDLPAAGAYRHLAGIADCATPIQRVHVSDRGHAGFVTLEAQDYGLAALGQVVELHDIGQRLFAQLREAPGITCTARRKWKTSPGEEGVSMTLDSGETIAASCWSPPTVRAPRWAPAAA
jgi:2-polyprenyl-6-methoxyphenol hydroxylase-like FAD-dependent oxidoreductase